MESKKDLAIAYAIKRKAKMGSGPSESKAEVRPMNPKTIVAKVMAKRMAMDTEVEDLDDDLDLDLDEDVTPDSKEDRKRVIRSLLSKSR